MRGIVMISTHGLSVTALKKEPFSGSHGGMRYYLAASGESLSAYIYPEPWCFEAAPDIQKEKKEFPFSQEGLDEAVAWIDERYRTDHDHWERIDKDKMRILLDTPDESLQSVH